jgi:hypothetical protein
VERREEERRDV